MGLLKHFLGGLVCRYLGRTPRRPRLGATPFTRAAQERRRKHLARCAACRGRQQRERQYLERLRGAAVPAASGDLTARLLARTGELAAGPEDPGPAGPAPAESAQGDPSAAPAAGPRVVPQGPQARHPRPWRLAVQIAGGVAATTALMGGASYVVGSDTPPATEGAFAAALPARLPGPALASETVSGAAWKLSGGPDVAPAGALSSEQLSALRARGWACPELRELGYHLLWARGGVADGSEVLELRLTDGRHFATVLEQHVGQPGPEASATEQAAAAVPVNVLTGHPATEDGFVPARTDGSVVPQGPAAAAGTLWVNRQAPFRAIYRTPAATFTYVSELPEEQADDGVGALVRSRPGHTAPAPGGDGVAARLERGLERIMELLAR
ncbi:hypothetical protein [Arthrobacter sp. UKPF54-2]|uniref:hypothetical protein n=1 Tax=Arthrobacter sp. UKPF54-2 TaxID=2600159 RepID=UPI0021BDE028|nr:hypothetical protein [Arthrobacter sp. UKPF54-2]